MNQTNDGASPESGGEAVLLHVGYHKTATSWLQAHVFDRKEFGFCSPFARPAIRERFVLTNTLDFDPAATRAWFEDGLPPTDRAEKGGPTVVLSEERLSGQPHSGGFDSAEIAHRLSEVFPQAKVFIAIREQRSMLASCYLQYVKMGGSSSLADYLNPPSRGRARVPMFDPLYFSYHRLIEHYIDLFGERNVLVLPYELFRSAPFDYLSRVFDFAGADSTALHSLSELVHKKRNRSAKYMTAPIERHLNRLISDDRLTNSAPLPSRRLKGVVRRLSRFIDRYLPEPWDFQKGAMRTYIDAYCRGRYESSNRRTSELVAAPLADFDYLIA